MAAGPNGRTQMTQMSQITQIGPCGATGRNRGNRHQRNLRNQRHLRSAFGRGTMPARVLAWDAFVNNSGSQMRSTQKKSAQNETQKTANERMRL